MKKIIKENELDICEDYYCRWCGTLVSKTTKICPSCGKQTQRAIIKKLDEREIAQNYVGKHFDAEKILAVSYQNGESHPEGYTRYIADCHNYKKETLNQFNITPTLVEYWGYLGIEFTLYIYVEDGTVMECKISKCRETGGYHGRPSVHVLTPSQQEIRIFRRIMDYITKE